ncbi:hypothetical protein [Jeotgalibacillus sp. JSM ZJ347]
MRSEQEMMALILDFAKKDERRMLHFIRRVRELPVDAEEIF